MPSAATTRLDVQHTICLGNDARRLLDREWLVTNALGGYASGTVPCVPTRRYHGLLIAALPAPLGRMMMLNDLREEVETQDHVALLGGDLMTDARNHFASAVPHDFRLEAGLPIWVYEVAGSTIEKRLVMPHLQNTVYISYRLVKGPPLQIRLHPLLHVRGHEEPIDANLEQGYEVVAVQDRFEIRSHAAPPLRLRMIAEGAEFIWHCGECREVHYREEQLRGYSYRGALWTPGYYRARLRTSSQVALVASVEPWETLLHVTPDMVWESEMQRRERLAAQASPGVQNSFGRQLVVAADQFIVRPATRVADEARAHAAGDDARTIIAGYHWFTDWGRDTMISLEGLTLTTRRFAEAGYILRTFSRHVRDGLLPNLFPEGQQQGVYHTADATLWFFHAIERYVRATGDRDTLVQLVPVLQDIVEHHIRGTRFGIRVDEGDDLLVQGEAGYQLTWMDAKVGDWVVTPRRGKAVEINALWYNALRLLEAWLRAAGDPAAADLLAARAQRTKKSFNRRFWNQRLGHLFDVVDGEAGDDDALRPNQLFAISLDHPVLEQQQWQSVIDRVAGSLLTPVGLRSLSPDHRDYKPTYDGDLRSRDAAYHQGTVWAWLIGPFVDAWLRVYPEDRAAVAKMLENFEKRLCDACIGSISEIFDAASPFTPRGCIAQAWSVAEVLRVLARLNADS